MRACKTNLKINRTWNKIYMPLLWIALLITTAVSCTHDIGSSVRVRPHSPLIYFIWNVNWCLIRLPITTYLPHNVALPQQHFIHSILSTGYILFIFSFIFNHFNLWMVVNGQLWTERINISIKKQISIHSTSYILNSFTVAFVKIAAGFKSTFNTIFEWGF